MTVDLLKLEHQLCHRFYVVSNAFTRAYRPLLSKLDLTYPQYIVMLALWEKDNISVSEALKMTMIDAGAMSLIMKKLEAKGYLAIGRDDLDQRVRTLSLTAAGKKLKQQARKIPESLYCGISHMSGEDILQLSALVDKLKLELADVEKRQRQLSD